LNLLASIVCLRFLAEEVFSRGARVRSQVEHNAEGKP
jgi:hypothetical protein